MIALSKADLDGEAAASSAAALTAHTGLEVVVVSAEEGEGTEPLMARLLSLVAEEKERAAARRSEELPVLRPASHERFAVAKEADGIFRVDGPRVVSFVEMMDLEMEGARDEVERRLERWGVAKELERAGVAEGDTVRFGTVDFAWLA